MALKAIKSSEGVILASDGQWSKRAKTPVLSFARLSPHSFNPERGQALIDLVFTGPVAVDDIRERALECHRPPPAQ